jgi:hypothetical protein
MSTFQDRSEQARGFVLSPMSLTSTINSDEDIVDTWLKKKQRAYDVAPDACLQSSARPQWAGLRVRRMPDLLGLFRDQPGRMLPAEFCCRS